MRAGNLDNNFGSSVPRSPNGFYRVTAQQAWPSINPYIMSRDELDKEIKDGITRYEKLFPSKSGMGFGEFVAIVAICAVGATAVAAAGTASAAGGAAEAGTAAASATGGAGAASTASGALAVGTGSTPAIAAGVSASSTLSTGAATAFGKQVFNITKNAAPYAKKVGKLYKQATGNNDADKLIAAADTVENSPSITDAAVKTFQAELHKRGMELNKKQAQQALRARIKKEQGAYAAWMRRRAQQLQNQNPKVQTSTTKAWMKWLPIATPFVMLLLRR